MWPYLSLQVQDCKKYLSLGFVIWKPLAKQWSWNGKTLKITVDFESQANYANNYVGIIKKNLWGNKESLFNLLNNQ